MGVTTGQRIELHQRQRFVHAPLALGFFDAVYAQAVGDVVAHVHMGENRVGLEHHVDRALVGRQPGDVAPVHANAAGGGIFKAADEA